MLLDTASLYFRAFFGVPDSVTAPNGMPVNAVRGLLEFINRLVDEYRPTHLACCWDNDWRPQWRVDLLPTYKAHRVVAPRPGDTPDIEEVPDPLEQQIPIIVAVLDAFGIAIVGADHYEADDVIGTLATDAGMPVDIVTGDRDLFQLVDDEAEVRVLYTARGVGKHERVTNDVLREKYDVNADQYAAFATLRGDSSDGLPGCGRCRRQDRRGAAEPVRRPRLDHRRRQGPRRRHGPWSAGQDQGLPRLPRAWRRRWSPSPATSTSAPPTCSSPPSPADPEMLAAIAEQWGLTSPVERLTATLAG